MLQAGTFQIWGQIGSRVINHTGTVHCHLLFSSIPNDSHNFALTNPASLCNFPNLSKLSEALHGYVLINYTLAAQSCQSSKQVRYTHYQDVVNEHEWVSQCCVCCMCCVCWGREREKEKPFGCPKAKLCSLHCPGKQKKCYQCQRIRAAALEWRVNAICPERHCIIMMSVSFCTHNRFE